MFWHVNEPLSESVRKISYRNAANNVAGIFVSAASAAYLPPEAEIFVDEVFYTKEWSTIPSMP
jgi:hypothetical protein